MRRRTRPGTRPPRRPMNRTRTPCSCSSSRRSMQQALVEVHEETHFVERPAPVLGGEREDRHVREADVERAFHRVEERLLPRRVAFGAFQAPLLRPPPVAVHDDGDVGRHPVGIEVHHRFGPYPWPRRRGRLEASKNCEGRVRGRGLDRDRQSGGRTRPDAQDARRDHARGERGRRRGGSLAGAGCPGAARQGSGRLRPRPGCVRWRRRRHRGGRGRGRHRAAARDRPDRCGQRLRPHVGLRREAAAATRSTRWPAARTKRSTSAA